MSISPRPTVGFGCPAAGDPHHMTVTVPRGRHEKVLITERYGVHSGVDGLPDEQERVELVREKWTAIAEPARRIFNERLKELGLASGRWQPGENQVERLLGKELVVLAWAIEHCAMELVPVAVQNWCGLKPEERWWLFTVTAAATGGLRDGEIGWRKALRFALTENPVKDPESLVATPRRRRPSPVSLPLFDT